MVEFLGIVWAGAHRFWAIIVSIGMVWLAIKNYWRIQTLAKILQKDRIQQFVFPGFSLARQKIKTVLFTAATVLLCLGLMQPQWGLREQTAVQEGRDILVLLDVSRSMLAEDFKPNRLEFAKLKIKALLEKMPAERFGLILFAGSAFISCPMTTDYRAFDMFLDLVDVEMISSGTTAIDRALLKGLEVFERIEGRTSKIMLLITDGEDFSTELNLVQQKATEEGVTLLSLGMATPEGAPIPKFDKYGKQIGHETDDEGTIHLSKLNEPLLQSISKQLNGTYVRASYNDSDLDQFVHIVQGFEKERSVDRTISVHEDRYPWFLGGALLLFIIEWLL